MGNETVAGDVLVLESFPVTAHVPSFIILLLVYLYIMVSNIGLLLLIHGSRHLRQPMYLLLCNMVVNDAFGATIVIPHVLLDILAAPSLRYIHYVGCAVQAFCVHLHASASHTILMIMAFDRYVAIGDPLRYSAIMSHGLVARLSAVAWASAAILVLVLVGLSLRLSRCRTSIANLFCDNASLFKLSCESVLANNIYGLGYTVVLLGSSIGSVGVTYLKIAVVCLRSKSQMLNRRALQTCTTHLVVYAILLVSGFIIVTLHRFPSMSGHRKMAAVLGHVALPALNGAIYGLQIKEVRQRIRAVFQKVGVPLFATK